MEEAKYVVAKDVATDEVKTYVESIIDQDFPIESIKSRFAKLIKAVMLGLVALEVEEPPVFTLRYPIQNTKGEDSVTELKFKSRVPVSKIREFEKAADNGKNALMFGAKCQAYLIEQPEGMLDKFERFDYGVISEVSSLFM